MSDEPKRTPEDAGAATQDGSAAKREVNTLPLDRFNAFSDGVFAIAITLLVLEISVPHAGVRVLPALRAQWPDFLGYFISFAFIGGIWIGHSGVTKFLKRADTESYAANLLLLLFVGLLPFSTALMVTHLTGPDARFTAAIYGVNLLLASVVLSLLILYLAREPSLLVDNIAEGTLRPHHPATLGRSRVERPCHRRDTRRPEGRGRPVPRREHAVARHPVPRPASPSGSTTPRIGARIRR